MSSPAGNWKYLTEGEPDLSSLIARVATTADGAVCTFQGTAREQSEGKSVRSLRYDAYHPMADQVIQQILEEARTRFGELRVAAMHRIGDCPLGESSVAVAAASPHRPEAFAACRFVIDEIKSRAPIWKQEVYADGTAWIGEPEPSRAPQSEKDS